MIFAKNLVILGLISLSFLFCSSIISIPRIVHRPDSESPTQILQKSSVIEEVNVLDNPLSGELLDCPVVANVAKDNNPWVKIKRDEVEFINIIVRDTKGRMWLATDGRGLTMFDGKEWHNWQPEEGIDMGYVAFRTMDVSDTKVFAGAYSSDAGGRLLMYDMGQDKWDIIRPGKGGWSNVIGGVTVNPQGQVFAVTTTGIDIYSDDQWTRLLRTPDNLGDARLHVEDALIDHFGNYWLAADHFAGIGKYDGKSWTTFNVKDGYLPSSEVTALAVDSKNRIWATTAYGLAVYDENGMWHTFPTDKYPWFSGWVEDVAIDPEDRVWVISHDFLTVYNGKSVAVFKPDEVGSKIWGDAIGFDKQGCVWVDLADYSSGLAVFRNRLNMEPGEFHFK